MTAEYSAHHLQVLEGLEAVRKRPGMYIGSNGSPGLMHCMWEIIDNSVDEAIAGNGDLISIILRSDGSVEVQDRGRGVPVDVEPRTGLSGVEVVFTKLHAGGKFGGGSYAASGGLHGVGASVVNALSERLDVEVDRGGKVYAMSFHRGEPGVFADSVRRRPDAQFSPFEQSSELPGGRQGQEGRDRHQGALLGGSADLHQGRGVPARRADDACAHRLLSSFRAWRSSSATSAIRMRSRSRPPTGSTAASPSSSTTSPRTHPSPTRGGSKARIIHGDGADAAARRFDAVDRSAARMPCRHRAAVGDGLRHDDALVREHHRHAQGRNASAGLRAGAAQAAAQRGREERATTQGRQRQARQGRRAGRADRCADGRAAGTAVRGSDQGGSRHACRQADRGEGRARADEGAVRLDQAR